MVQIHYERLDTICGYGGMADTTDLKSVAGNSVPVQVRLPAPLFLLERDVSNGQVFSLLTLNKGG